MTEAHELARNLAQIADKNKGEDITILDVSEQHSLIDCFVVVTARNAKHASVICDEATLATKAKGDGPHHRETGGEWVCVDFFNVVLHVFSPDARDYYDFESLWADATKITWTPAPNAISAQG